MAARLAIGLTPEERLRRLSIVFALELRLKIVAELHMRQMSVKQFHEEFGGGSLARVDRSFKALAKEGWLRRVRSAGPGGNRRGAVEHFYRATEPAFFDAEAWALLPYSVRMTSSWNIFKQIGPRLREAIEAIDESAGPRRELSCEQIQLDERGWKNVIGAIDAQFTTLFEEQEDARLRVSSGGGRLVPMDVFMLAFESPTPDEPGEHGDALVESPRKLLIPFHERLSPVIGDSVRTQIVAELNHREMSPTQFHREFGSANPGAVYRRFNDLDLHGWLAMVDQKRRRGATERFYRATKPTLLDYDPCADPPEALIETKGWRTFERFCKKAIESMAAGTLDGRVDRYTAWSFISLDPEGLESVVGSIDALAEQISRERDQAAPRLAKSGKPPIAMTVALAALEAAESPVTMP
jgi:DNA-binding PadR family transcriptional regulator